MGNPQTKVVLGMDFNEVQGELNHLRDAFLLLFPLALLLAAAGGWVVGSRALNPLKAIAETAERVTARGLDQRIPVSDSEGEVARVVQVLNGMMDRLEKSFHQATRFTADASHELKTPLTIMQGELESALQLAAIGSKEQQLCTNLLEEVQRLKKITRTLLLLAQADAGQMRLSREQVDFSQLLEDAIEDARILGSDLKLGVRAQVQPKLCLVGDPLLLSTAVHNVLGNAIKYNEPGGRVVVQGEARRGWIELLVGNTGPGIPKRDQVRIFERFVRSRPEGDATRQPVEGMGLGLSLAREILRAHGGEVELKESGPGWTSFSIRLPAAGPERLASLQ